MERSSIKLQIFATVFVLFVINTILFIVFQQQREKKYKIELLNTKLQDYNTSMAEMMRYMPVRHDSIILEYVVNHRLPGLRVTVLNQLGHVLFDNETANYNTLPNHKDRDEIKKALLYGSGYDINRSSRTLHQNYFYSATYFPADSLIIRSALPYNHELTLSLQADHRYIWFSLIVFIILALVLYHFTKSLGRNINNLRTFAQRADNNEPLDTEDLAQFPTDELGEISEYIIKLYIRLQKTKEEQNQLKRQLTQNIAHELKTPVSSIQGYMETLIENPEISQEQKLLFLQRSYAQCQRLTNLLRDISALNRLDDDPNLCHTFEKTDLRIIIDNILKEVSLQLQERNMRLDCQLPEHLELMGNPSLLYSIFRNLTDNAIAYAGNGTTISIACEVSDDFLHFTFSDDGVGVGNEHLDRLFERFYRIDKGRSRKLGGTGLGLAIVKNAILLHGGTVSAHNLSNGGLAFKFNLKRGEL